ncbi:hypothetical protein RFI_35421, partial [Reticulomyxa filosa]
IRDRIRRWKQKDLQSLWNEFIDHSREISSHSLKPARAPTKSDKLRSCRNFAALGEYSNAFRALHSQGRSTYDKCTIDALKAKHPSEEEPKIDLESFNSHPRNPFTKEEVIAYVQKLRRSSSGGPDFFSAQYLLDMIPFEVESGVVSQWTQVAQLIGEDKVNVEGAAIAYGARLIAIPKPDGSPRPIAIGCLLRRTAAAILSTRHKHKVQQAVGAKQFGINVPSGVEVFVHGFKATVQWASKDKNRVAVKVDFKNAFNIIRRKKLLELVGSRLPSLFKYVHGCYVKH